MRLSQANRGSTLILTMIFVSIFATLAVAYTAATNMNLQQADSHRKAQSAQLAAESGLAHAVAILRGMQLNSADSDEDMLQAAADLMAATLDGTATIGGASITFDGTTVRTPDIAFAATGQTYRVEMSIVTAGSLGITVHGTAAGVTRGLQLQMTPGGERSSIFDFGIASRSRIVMSGNASITGANDPGEANILSTTYSVDEAVNLTGNCDIGGDISTSNPDSYVTVTGNASIGGTSDWDDMQDHIHIGIGDVPFPEVDPTVFEPFATNIVDGSTSTSGSKTFENIRIRAGTNPTFAGNITIRGVVYIEQPNTVKFTGNLNLTGVIITEDAGDDAYDTNTIQFTGNMNTAGVEALPDEAPFTQLRQMPGSMLLAPGFGVKFTGNFKTMNGTIAADKFTFTGNSRGTIAGSVICYSDSDFTLTGNSRLTIDQSQYSGDPPGFAQAYALGPLAGSYLEL